MTIAQKFCEAASLACTNYLAQAKQNDSAMRKSFNEQTPKYLKELVALAMTLSDSFIKTPKDYGEEDFYMFKDGSILVVHLDEQENTCLFKSYAPNRTAFIE